MKTIKFFCITYILHFNVMSMVLMYFILNRNKRFKKKFKNYLVET